MKQTIDNAGQMQDVFIAYGRGKSFSWGGFRVLFDWFEELDPDYELDPVAIDCDFVESDITTILKEYDLADIDELRDRTTVLEVDNETVIYQVF